MSSIFLCHSNKDKEFVRRLSADLQNSGIETWLDEAELLVGDSLLERISFAIEKVDYLAVILSPDSVASNWVRQELEMAMNHQLKEGRIKVLPIYYRTCHLPDFLAGKKYADFRGEKIFDRTFSELIKRLKVNNSTISQESKNSEKQTNRSYLKITVSTGRNLPDEPVLIVKNLDCSFYEHNILKNLNLRVRKGEIFGFYGTSGQGKSVLVDVISGQKDCSGHIEVWSGTHMTKIVYSKKTPSFGNKLVRVVRPLDFSPRRFLGTKTVINFLKEEKSLVSQEKQNIKEFLYLFGIEEYLLYRKVTHISYGQALRISFIKALLSHPSVLILDNVIDSFSPDYYRRILQPLFEMNSHGLSIILTCNDFTRLAPWCDRVGVLQRGTVDEVDTPAELVKKFGNNYPML